MEDAKARSSNPSRSELRAPSRRWISDLVVKARNRDPAVGLLQRRQRAGQSARRVRHDATVLSRVEIDRRRTGADLEVGDTAHGGKNVRHTGRKHHGIRDDDVVACQPFPVSLQEGRKTGAPDFLLPFDQHDDIDGQAAASTQARFERRDVDPELSLVVGGTPGVQPPVPDRSDERRRGPELERLGWLDVVVPIDQYRRRAAPGAAPLRQHDRMTWRSVTLGHEPDALQLRREPVGTPRHIRSVLGLGADTWHRQERVQPSENGRLVIKQWDHLLPGGP